MTFTGATTVPAGQTQIMQLSCKINPGSLEQIWSYDIARIMVFKVGTFF
jgi:hypothetical protein